MATVTFPIELGGNGLVVSDDTDPVTGLRNGGYLTRFVPALQQTVAVAGFVVTQASNAANSATSAGNSATSAGNSAASSANSAASAATLYDQFDDRVLGPKAGNPTLDNDGNALLVGAIYFNTTAMETRVWNGTTWQSASVNGGTVNSLTVTGAFEYQGTFTGGAGVMNIGGGQIFKDAAGNVGFGFSTPRHRLQVLNALKISDGTQAQGSLILGDGDSTAFNVGVARWNGATNSPGAGGLGYFSQAVANSGGHYFYLGDAAAGATDLAAALFGNGNFALNRTSTAFRLDVAAADGNIAKFAFDGGDAALEISAPTGNTIAITSAVGDTLTLGAGGVEALRLPPSRNLLVGTTVDNGYKINALEDIGIRTENDATGVGALRLAVSTSLPQGAVAIRGVKTAAGDAFMQFDVTVGGATGEAARLTSAKYFKASDTGSYLNGSGASIATATLHSFHQSLDARCADFICTSTSVGAVAATTELPSSAAGKHQESITGGITVHQVLVSGSVENATNSYGAISDPKLKDILGPKSSTWEKTKQYNWIEYYLKSDINHEFKMMGLNAAEAALVSPGVIDSRPDLIEVHKVRQVPVRIARLDENGNPVVDEETGAVIYDEVVIDEEYTEWEPNGEFTLSAKYSVISMQYHRTTQECQVRIEDLEFAKVQTDDLIQQIMGRVAALESSSA